MAYIVRDNKGIMIAKIPNDIAGEIISSCKGWFKPFKESFSFLLEEERVIVFKRDEIKLYIWEGYKLEPILKE